MIKNVIVGFYHLAIIALALVLIITIATKESSNLVFYDFQKQVNTRLDKDRQFYENKLKTLEDNLNTYQMTRESRAQLYSKRLDELYDLYRKDPNPIDLANSSKPSLIVHPTSDNNFSYLESKTNKVDEKVDNLDNKLSSRISIVEKRIELIQSDSGSRIINTNINTVGNSTAR